MIYNFLIKATKGKYASCSLYYTEIRGRYMSFLHSRRINRLAVLCFVTTETIGKGVRGTKRNVYGCKWKAQKYKELGDVCLKRNVRNG